MDLFASPAFPIADHNQPEADALVRNVAAREGDGIQFTEVMAGFIHVGSDVKDFKVAESIARSRCESARFFLSIDVADTRSSKSTAM